MAKLTPLKAIRAKCMDCTAGQFIEIRLCTCTECPLYEYRMGKRPKGEESIAEEVETENGADSAALIGTDEEFEEDEDE